MVTWQGFGRTWRTYESTIPSHSMHATHLNFRGFFLYYYHCHYHYYYHYCHHWRSSMPRLTRELEKNLCAKPEDKPYSQGILTSTILSNTNEEDSMHPQLRSSVSQKYNGWPKPCYPFRGMAHSEDRHQRQTPKVDTEDRDKRQTPWTDTKRQTP